MICFHLSAEVASDRVWRVLAPAGVEARLGHLLGRARGVLHEGPLDPLEGLQPRALVQHHAVIRLPDFHLNVTTCNIFQLIIQQYLNIGLKRDRNIQYILSCIMNLET